jgi:putative NADH-flavin reductase
MKGCIVGASGKLGRYMVQHALDRGYAVVGVCREESVGKLDAFKGCNTIVPGATKVPEVIKRTVTGCDGVLVVWSCMGSKAPQQERHKRCSTTSRRVRA